jgi:signal transduction histidine kinase
MTLGRLFDDSRSLFWLLQLIGWSGWSISYYLGAVVWAKPPSGYHLYLVLIGVIGMLLTLALRLLYQSSWQRPLPGQILRIALGSAVAACVWTGLRSVLFFNLFPGEREEAGLTLASGYSAALSAFWVMLVWSALYFGIKYYLLMQDAQKRGLRTTAMAHEAQLKMLRYQLNPHFLFNTLNAISTLILERDTQLANTMVMRLSEFLRYSLDNDPMQQVSVREELRALMLYLDIEKVRFGEQLQLFVDIAPEAEQALVPSLLLQPLVENSIKYAVAQSADGGCIAISAAVEGDELVLSVADDGPGLDLSSDRNSAEGGGVGLLNCRERLRTLYGARQSFRLSNTEPNGLTVTLRLPLSGVDAAETARVAA